jgi:hypothetical protein
VDGSQDGNQEPITHIVAVTSNQWNPFFLKELTHGTEVHSANNILKHLAECKQELLQNGISVNGIISDNEEKMKKVRKEFYRSHASEPNNVVSAPGDPPHALQLVIGDFLKSDDVAVSKYKLTTEKAQYIAGKFKNTRYLYYAVLTVI